MIRYKDKYNKRTDEKTQIILAQHHPCFCNMWWSQCLLQRPVQQLKINGYNESTGQDSPCKAPWCQGKYANSDRKKYNPVGPRDKLEQPSFYTHGLNFPLQIAAFFHGQIYVAKPCNDAKTKKDKRKPWRGIKYPRIKPIADAQPENNGQGHGETQAAVIPQLLVQLLGLFIHDKERLPKRWSWQYVRSLGDKARRSI